MRGLAFGLLDPDGERYRLAVLHRRECPSCRAYVASLRGLAAVLPPISVPWPAAGGAVAVAGAASGGGGWLALGGGLAAKVAASCALAVGLGAGCVALTHLASSRAARPHTEARVHRHPHARRAESVARPRHLVAFIPAAAVPATAGPVLPAARSRRQTPRAHQSRGQRAARAGREFGIESEMAAPVSNADTATVRASAATVSSARPSAVPLQASGGSPATTRQAEREFGVQ